MIYLNIYIYINYIIYLMDLCQEPMFDWFESDWN